MKTYTTATEDAAAIRATLKAKGWTSRQVFVRADYYAGGSSIDLIIKDPTVPLAPVKAAAEDKERIHRCEMSGEILSGANRFVSVRYSDEAAAALGAPLLPALTEAAARLAPGDDSTGIPVPGIEGAYLYRGRWGHGFVVYLGDRRLPEGMDLAGAAYSLAVARQGDK